MKKVIIYPWLIHKNIGIVEESQGTNISFKKKISRLGSK